jgi:hypothetical protein
MFDGLPEHRMAPLSAPDRILLKERGDNNRCHMKIATYGDPAMPTEREVVDYYGPCDERPSR